MFSSEGICMSVEKTTQMLGLTFYANLDMRAKDCLKRDLGLM